jgi:hypothetical protein
MTSEVLLLSPNSTIYQLYPGENKLINDDGNIVESGVKHHQAKTKHVNMYI